MPNHKPNLSSDTSQTFDDRGESFAYYSRVTMGERIASARIRAGLTQKAVSERLNVSSAAITQWERNSTQPRGNKLKPLADTLGVDLEWLMTGHLDSSDVLLENAQTHQQVLGDVPAIVDFARTEYVALARYDAALSAGPGCINDLSAEPLTPALIERQWLRAVTATAPDNLIVLMVDGDSMAETLRDRDWVLIDRTQTRLNREGVYALQFEDVTWIKRLSVDLVRKIVRVISDNPMYPVQEHAVDDIMTIGRVLMVISRRI